MPTRDDLFEAINETIDGTDRVFNDEQRTMLKLIVGLLQSAMNTDSPEGAGALRGVYADVGDFHKKFDLPFFDPTPDTVPVPHLISDNVFLYRCAFMIEELLETMLAHQNDDLPKVADGLIDLIYIAAGTGHMMHLPGNELWAEVHAANMRKERGSTPKRGHVLDVKKPDGWTGPRIVEILESFGWTRPPHMCIHGDNYDDCPDCRR